MKVKPGGYPFVRSTVEYCGCCGRETKGDWCKDCVPHLGPATLKPWDRIFAAMNGGKDCPFSEPVKAVTA